MCVVIQLFLLSCFCCLAGVTAHANQTVFSGWDKVHVQPGTLTTLSDAEQTTTTTQLYITPGTLTSGWNQVSVQKTQTPIRVYITEGTPVAGLENMQQAKISYIAPQPSTQLKAQTEESPCLPPLPIPDPKEQGNHAISVISPVKTKEHFSITKTQGITYLSLSTTRTQNLRTTNNSYTTDYYPTPLTNLPFLSGFSGLAPPTE